MQDSLLSSGQHTWEHNALYSVRHYRGIHTGAAEEEEDLSERAHRTPKSQEKMAMGFEEDDEEE